MEASALNTPSWPGGVTAIVNSYLRCSGIVDTAHVLFARPRARVRLGTATLLHPPISSPSAQTLMGTAKLTARSWLAFVHEARKVAAAWQKSDKSDFG